MAKQGEGQPDEMLIFACAGAAHCGHAAYEAGKQLAREKVGNLFCIASVAARRPEKMERARAARRRVVVDGCDEECCRHIMSEAGLPVEVYVAAKDLGVEKKPEQPDLAGDTAKIIGKVKALIGSAKA